MVVTPFERAQRGMSLVELMVAVAISSILLLALQDTVGLGLRSAQSGHAHNELAYQAGFALERIADQARLTPARAISAAGSDTTGNWFAPPGCSGSACVKFCRNNSSRQLIRTTTTDTGCTGTGAVASQVSAFVANLPADAGAYDRPSIELTITLDDLAGHISSYTMRMRLGGDML